MKSLLLAIPLFIAVTVARAQESTLSQQYDNASFDLINLRDHLDVNFKWITEGKLQVLMNEGVNDYLEGNIQQSIGNLNQLIALESGYWPAFYFRGLGNKSLGNLAAAKEDFLKALEIDNKVPEILLELGEIHAFQRSGDVAQRYYERAMTINPKSCLPYFYLGNLAAFYGRTPAALEYYKTCTALNPAFAPALMYQGLLQIDKIKKNYKVCINFLNMAQRADSSYRPVYLWRSIIYWTMGEKEKGLSDISKLIRLMPTNYRAMFMRGIMLAESNRFEDAFVDLRKVVMAINVDHNQYMTGNTSLNKQADFQNAALYLVQKGYGLNEKTFYHLKKGYCLMLLSRYAEAIKEFESSEGIQPNAPGYLLLALAHEEFQNWGKAVSNYEAALRLDPDIYDAYRKLVIYRLESNNLEGVIGAFNQMKRLSPSTINFRLQGMVKSRIKDYQGCVADLSTYTKLDSADYEVWNVLAHCHAQTSNFTASYVASNRAISLKPLEVPAYTTMYDNTFLNADTVARLGVIRRMKSKWPANHLVSLMLAEVFIDMKKYDSAALIVNPALKELEMNYPDSKILATALYCDGRLMAERGELKRGLESIGRSIKMDPDKNERIFYRAKLYFLLGDGKSAVKDLQKLKKAQFAPADKYIQLYLGK